MPVVGNDAHLPALPADWLNAGALRHRLHNAHQSIPEILGDGTVAGSTRRPAAAAVLVPLVQRESGLQVLLTQRTDHLRSHAGQISFPGGRSEPEDTDAAATALREAYEEVGLDPAGVEVVAQLPVYTTVTQFQVTPVVALVRSPIQLVLDPFEVAEAFEVPLAFLMNPAHHWRHDFDFEGHRRQFLSMPWRSPPGHRADHEYFIWGATAAMLRNLYSLLANGGASPAGTIIQVP